MGTFQRPRKVSLPPTLSRSSMSPSPSSHFTFVSQGCPTCFQRWPTPFSSPPSSPTSSPGGIVLEHFQLSWHSMSVHFLSSTRPHLSPRDIEAGQKVSAVLPRPPFSLSSSFLFQSENPFNPLPCFECTLFPLGPGHGPLFFFPLRDSLPFCPTVGGTQSSDSLPLR